MKQGIHPEYKNVTIRCVCGNAVETHITSSSDVVNVEICSMCHPFYTGKQKLLDSAGRIERFRLKYKNLEKTKNS